MKITKEEIFDAKKQETVELYSIKIVYSLSPKTNIGRDFSLTFTFYYEQYPSSMKVLKKIVLGDYVACVYGRENLYKELYDAIYGELRYQIPEETNIRGIVATRLRFKIQDFLEANNILIQGVDEFSLEIVES